MMVRRSQTAIASSTVLVGDTIPGLDRQHHGGDAHEQHDDAYSCHDENGDAHDVKIILTPRIRDSSSYSYSSSVTKNPG